jgi:hypothetical protein
VSETAAALQEAGLIPLQPQVTILDRAGLQEAACECYDVIRRGYDQMFEDSFGS